MKNILLGITGSIAAYKAADLANRLTKAGHSVHVVMTRAAAEFITPLTLQTLTKHKVYTDMFEPVAYEDVRHISLAKQADLCLIAPATANIIGKIAAGVADDMLSTVVMAVKAPVLICPAMNAAMYENPVTQANIKRLSGFGYHFVEPKEALLACGDMGKGALADLADILAAVNELLEA
ncbi:MAG: bifunctional phosphopantothenoylcysteine decarboxylase/phosphopantothenate--cysteine ligase CoaBC [Clostridiales Family XIII bacterium]|jgi:phosphopantothenoylcysteine decarboxylase/phosphopantothenoylcysteine decarboxylase/phosphopantothenate--cysteine ligase|nr:bifunctional phosphopantothenoylcysteine decarboxylase/phosphopantothenate--cysteine ligase CoaBC [Clostridiales Family XIII bacterium]